MITRTNHINILPIVRDAVIELFEHCIKKECRPNEFLIFLEGGHYENEMQFSEKYSKYILGGGFANAKDLDRISFIETYLKIPFEESFVQATNDQDKFDIRRSSLNLELMIYVHFWESKVFIRNLRQLAILSEGKEYDWHLNPKPEKTYEYIRDNIRTIFEQQNLKIFDVIKKCYRNQIRNAFAHSDLYFSNNNIHLDN